jgi:hypothetical protein
MKKLRCALSAGVAALLLSLSNAGKGDLKEITKPYLGEYECTQALLGENDYLKLFSYITCELKDKGVFTISYKSVDGKKKEIDGEYEYVKERKVLLVKDKKGYQREYPLENGRFTVIVPYGNKTLHLTFEQK